jgi:2,3-bisphosphoglycerate-dependent phosphoglycerate mutase
VSERALPFYINTVLPKLKEGMNVLITAHGNSIRALMRYIEDIPERDMGKIEMLFGCIVEYEVNADGKMTAKKTYAIESPPPPA